VKLARFAVETPVGEVSRLGAAVNEHMVDLRASYAASLEAMHDPHAEQLAAIRLPEDMLAFLGGGSHSMKAAEEALSFALGEGRGLSAGKGRLSFELKEVRVLCPLPRPTTLKDCGLFYPRPEHKSGEPTPRPAYYKGNPASVIGPNDPILWPSYEAHLDFELELAAIIGKRGKNISMDEADSFIAGYTIFNDCSARDTEMAPVARGQRMDLNKGKDFDNGNVLGPYLVTPDEIDLKNLVMRARVNGEVWSEGSTASMTWSFAEMICFASLDETLFPGDVIASGTVPTGSSYHRHQAGMPERWIQPGDVIELEAVGIGILRNQVIKL
jgi:2-keto-4-pentenoate hydratase/2-oxohepta-3-ene-1,7-dioic acid hydratase in catechol pathway